ncbi:MAG: choice-of-anchor X domain-containing protein [Paraglaciecola sp.]|uniref:choice-of-anchor X domain-containing protein n=2 Tax=Paraglaciecola sp. TaxID=1920173 RepID=UPI003267A32E
MSNVNRFLNCIMSYSNSIVFLLCQFFVCINLNAASTIEVPISIKNTDYYKIEVGDTFLRVPVNSDELSAIAIEVFLPLPNSTMKLVDGNNLTIATYDTTSEEYTDGSEIGDGLPGGAYHVYLANVNSQGRFNLVLEFDSATESVSAFISAVISAPIKARLILSETEAFTGNPVTIALTLNGMGQQTVGLKPVLGIFDEQLHVTRVISLLDDGVGVDSAANDGVYSAVDFPESAGTFIYQTQPQVDDDRVTILPKTGMPLTVHSKYADIVDTRFTSEVVEGCVDNITQEVDIYATKADEYMVRSTLIDTQHNELVIVGRISLGANELGRVFLTFNKDEIRRKLPSGAPYKIKYTKLIPEYFSRYLDMDTIIPQEQAVLSNIAEVCLPDKR